MGPLMQRFRALRKIGYLYGGMKCYVRESSSFGGFDHRSFRIILVGHDDYPGVGTEVQVPKHVAARQSGNKKFFGIVSSRISPKYRIRRTGNHWFLTATDLVCSFVSRVTFSTLSDIPRPHNGDRIVMFTFHGWNKSSYFSSIGRSLRSSLLDLCVGNLFS